MSKHRPRADHQAASPQRKAAPARTRTLEPDPHTLAAASDQPQPSALTPQALMRLQRVCGNQAVQRMVAPAGNMIQRFPLHKDLTFTWVDPYRRMADQTVKLSGETLIAMFDRAIKNKKSAKQQNHPVHFADQIKAQRGDNMNQVTPFNMGGVALEMGKNNYVKEAGSEENAPSYGTLRTMVEAYQNEYIQNHANTTVADADRHLAREVRTALKHAGSQNNQGISALSGVLAGVLGVAENMRNSRSLGMLLMFLDLVEAGQATWIEGLGPNKTDRNSLSAAERVAHFGVREADVQHVQDNQAGIDVTDKPDVKLLKKWVANHDLQGDVKKSVLGEGNTKSVSALGGSLSMVGAGSAGSGEGIQGNDLIDLVHKKEQTMVIRWLEMKLQNRSNQITQLRNQVDAARAANQQEPDGPNWLDGWYKLAGAERNKVLEYLIGSLVDQLN